MYRVRALDAILTFCLRCAMVGAIGRESCDESSGLSAHSSTRSVCVSPRELHTCSSISSATAAAITRKTGEQERAVWPFCILSCEREFVRWRGGRGGGEADFGWDSK